ncbi:MAG: helicase C-terminal domain-containing protein [Thermomicrobiales bacterium]
MIEQFAALDLEATGMDPARHEIIEIAVIVFTRTSEIERFETLIRPRAALPLDIQRLTGITPAEVKGAPTMDEAASRIRRLVAGRAIVGQSIEMDLAMLDAAGVRISSPLIDTFELATFLLPDLPNYSLHAIAQELRIDVAVDHRAARDAELTVAVFRGLLERIDQFDRGTLEQIAGLSRAAGLPFAEFFEQAARIDPGPLFERKHDVDFRAAHELSFLSSREKPEPLRSTGSDGRVAKAVIAETLRESGPLSHVVPGYEFRAPQQQMANAVANVMNEGGTLLVEAGTGTGKSVAYLLPAMMHSVERGERVVVSTNTLALQDQLQKKDIPDLQEVLDGANGDGPVRTSVLKGRANYLCLRRWFAHHRQPIAGQDDAKLRSRATLWLTQTETGDRAELRMTPEEENLFRGISADGEACSAAKCVYQQRNQCFLFRARRQAENAHIVIVNHALLLSDSEEGSRVLPDYHHLVVDEAHHLEDQATAQFGFTVNEMLINDYLDGVLRHDGTSISGVLAAATGFLSRSTNDEASKIRAAEAISKLQGAANHQSSAKLDAADLFVRLGELIESMSNDRSGYERSMRITPSTRRSGDWMSVEIGWERVDQQLRAVEDNVRYYLENVERTKPPKTGEELAEDEGEDIAIELSALLRSSGDLRAKLHESLNAPSDAAVYWISKSPMLGRISINAAPLHVGEMLQQSLFEPLETAVLTSATLTTDGSFDYLRERLGIHPTRELAVSSPFDYQRSTLLYLANDMPEPSASGYQQRLHEALIEFCTAMGGRTLVLFTSHVALQSAYRATRGQLGERGVLVLAQRIDGSARQLIDRLKADPNVVVFGTATFWEGVDVVGPALSAIVITKLPFSVPSDPVFAARSELFEEPFLQYAVPQAVLKFKQGFGRLIRSSKDRGICVVLDRRIVSKRYGASFVQSLPACTVSVGSVDDLPNESLSWLHEAMH